jgi:CDP-glucose 4,6-dehydratase
MERAGNSGFWRGRRVLVTGHTGFKGAWLALLLGRLGAEVAGFALPPEHEGSLFQTARVSARVRSTFGDIRDLVALRTAVERSAPELILHLAAQALVLPSYEAPLATYSVNVLGTVTVLEVARRSPSVRGIVVVTSDKVYENREWLWGYREQDSLGGRDPYSSSKACAELVSQAYRESFLRDRGIALATSRAGNVVGGGDWAKNRIVPDFVRAAMEVRPLTVRNPASTRPWQHVLDPLRGYLLLAERLLDGGGSAEGAWNFGPSGESVQPVSRVADTLASLWGAGASWAHEPGAPHQEAHLLSLDSTRSCTELGWRPKLGFDRALRWTVDWYKAYQQEADMERQTLGQIDSYLEMAS